MIRRAPAAALLFAALVFAAPLLAQSPAADWRTVTTPHFRVHYPRDLEAWALHAASRLESVRAAVVAEVGFAPEKVTDVLIVNPVADANGITLPLLDSPRIVYFTEPPDPESTIGEYSDWIDLLTVHETTHLVHLMRPSRNDTLQLLERLLPLNPITLSAPRWLLEGYATVVEGRITGSGRPHSARRAAILRKWAISGRLPSYGQLDSSREFLGMSMAYLAGSAYLEWLERRSGPASLRHLWTRMTARQRRSFDEAFIGVFGESPRRLYGQFTAELTASSMKRDEAAQEGELWQETKSRSGDPAISPDGRQLAMVLRNEKGEARLVVLSTGPNEAELKAASRLEKILKRDPEDVAPIRTKPLPRKPLHTLQPSDGGDVETPRWTPDGASLIYAHRQPDRDGFLHHDLFRWTPGTSRVERLTHLADVKDAEPLDATQVVAVRNRGGASQLVNVNLATGEVTDRTPPSFVVVYARPRASASGRIAWSQHDPGGWHVVVDGRDAGSRGSFGPEWAKDGTLYATVATNDTLAIARIDIARTDAEAVTVVARASGALEQPAAAPDGSLYFMSLEPDGMVVRHLTRPAALGVAEPQPVAAPPSFAAQPVSAPRRYGIGRPEFFPLFGGSYARDFHAVEAGVRIGDVAGRLDTLILGSAGDLRGAALAMRWRGWPVNAGLHAFTTRDQHGVELRGSYAVHSAQRAWWLDAGTLLGDHSLAFADTSFRLTQRRVASEELRLAADSRRHARASLRVAGRAGDLRGALTLTGARRDVALGGLPSSIVPDSLNIPRIFEPALARLTTSSYRGVRAEVTSGGVTFFVQQHRLHGSTFRVAGAVATLRSDVEPLLKIAAFDLTAGIARVIEEHRTRAWIGLRWRP